MHRHENTCARMRVPGAVPGVRFICGKMLFPLLWGHGWPWGGQCHLLVNPLRFHMGISDSASVFPWAGVWRGGLFPSPCILPQPSQSPAGSAAPVGGTPEAEAPQENRNRGRNEAKAFTVPSTLAGCQGGERVPAGRCPSVPRGPLFTSPPRPC